MKKTTRFFIALCAVASIAFLSPPARAQLVPSPCGTILCIADPILLTNDGFTGCTILTDYFFTTCEQTCSASGEGYEACVYACRQAYLAEANPTCSLDYTLFAQEIMGRCGYSETYTDCVSSGSSSGGGGGGGMSLGGGGSGGGSGSGGSGGFNLGTGQ